MKNSKKFEIWPYAIIVSFILFGGFIFYAIFTSAAHDAPLVTEDYYAQEIAFQDQIDKVKMTHLMKKNVTLNLDRSANNLTLDFPLDTFPTTFTKGNITLYRASDTNMDTTLGMNIDKEGNQQIDLKNLARGYWKVLIDWQEGGVSFYQEEEIII